MPKMPDGQIYVDAAGKQVSRMSREGEPSPCIPLEMFALLHPDCLWDDAKKEFVKREKSEAKEAMSIVGCIHLFHEGKWMRAFEINQSDLHSVNVEETLRTRERPPKTQKECRQAQGRGRKFYARIGRTVTIDIDIDPVDL